MFLSAQLKQDNDDYIKRTLPRFAEQIITEQRTVKPWLIQKLVCLDKVPTYPGNFGWEDHACIVGDDDDAISLIFFLKKAVLPGRLNSFRRIGLNTIAN